MVRIPGTPFSDFDPPSFNVDKSIAHWCAMRGRCVAIFIYPSDLGLSEPVQITSHNYDGQPYIGWENQECVEARGRDLATAWANFVEQLR